MPCSPHLKTHRDAVAILFAFRELVLGRLPCSQSSIFVSRFFSAVERMFKRFDIQLRLEMPQACNYRPIEGPQRLSINRKFLTLKRSCLPLFRSTFYVTRRLKKRIKYALSLIQSTRVFIFARELSRMEKPSLLSFSEKSHNLLSSLSS